VSCRRCSSKEMFLYPGRDEKDWWAAETLLSAVSGMQ
jgi:hypothetical protein